MKTQIRAAHKEAVPALNDASSLLEEREEVEKKRKLLDAFKSHFIMSDDEVAALTLNAEPVDDRFFDSLLRAKKISKDCEVLLGFEKQTLGTELMEQTSKNVHLGFQKLYKWVQREFKTLNLENPQMNSSIRKSLRVLAERPSLFQNCLDFFSEARESILSDAFYLALTGTSSSAVEEPSIKPIDLTAHDPLRYVGDMLAWIHSTAVSEHEALEVLFVAEGEELAKGLKSGRDAEIWRLVAEDGEADNGDFNALKALNNLVDRDVSGAVRMMRQRIEQVIQSNEEIVTAYRLANLINFYRITFLKLLGPESNLLQCIGNLEAEGLRQFRGLMRDYVTTIQGENQSIPSNLGPPSFLQKCLEQLGAICKTYETSLSAVEDRETDFQGVLAEGFEPFLSGCDNMASAVAMPDRAVFLINCKLAAAKSLDRFEFTLKRAQELREDVASTANELSKDQYGFFRERSGLDVLFRELEKGPASSLDEKTLSLASQTLDDFLPSAYMDALERLKYLQESVLTRRLTEAAAERFCQDFEKLERVIGDLDDRADSREESSSLRSIFPRTTGEIKVLLS